PRRRRHPPGKRTARHFSVRAHFDAAACRRLRRRECLGPGQRPSSHAAARGAARVSAMSMRAPFPPTAHSSLTAVRTGALRTLIREAADAQRRWAATPLKQRLRVLRRFRQRLAADAIGMAATIDRRPAGETVASEIWPLLEASRY